MEWALDVHLLKKKKATKYKACVLKVSHPEPQYNADYGQGIGEPKYGSLQERPTE